MKKIFITALVLLIGCIGFALELPKDFNIYDYVDKPYYGTPYEEALKKELPFLLIFAKPSNIVVLAKLFPIIEMVYDEFQGQYNYCIINAKINDNEDLVKFYAPKKYPALYIIDTQNRTYTLIEKKYYNKRDIKEILTRFKNGTLFD